MIKTLILGLITILVLILGKTNEKFKINLYKNVYNKNFSFAQINKWYESKFGSSIPFNDYFSETLPVFNETLKYKDESIYKDGVKLTVENNLIPSLENGIVIFLGEKEGYGKTVILEQENGIEVWYSNLENVNVKLYDYIKKGSLIGEVNKYLYLVFIKDGEVINYKEHI